MTKVERRLLQFLFRYINEYGYAPNCAEMLVEVRKYDAMATLRLIDKMLVDLVKMSYIEMPNGLDKPRALQLLWVNPKDKAA